MYTIHYGFQRFRVIAIAICVLSGFFPASNADAQGIQIDRQTILHNGKVLRGFHAVYLNLPHPPADEPKSRAEIERTLDKMKNDFGLKGFTLSVAWSVVERAQDSFWFPHTIDSVIAAANRRGMVVNILLSGHDTPDWVYKQEGIDVMNRGVNEKTGVKDTARGNWLNYSPSSPEALVWLGAFQKKAVEYYKKLPGVISFNVTNETTLFSSVKDPQDTTKRIKVWIDYSAHAESAWDIWRSVRSMPKIPMPLISEEPLRPDDWRNWMLFRQDNLNKFFNTTYRQARSGLGDTDSHLVFHRHQWNSASYGLSDLCGLYLDPNESIADIIGGNNYGTNEVMAAMMQSAGKPIFLTETSHQVLGNAAVAVATDSASLPGRLNSTLLEQFFQGAQNQTIYQFSTHNYFPMFKIISTNPYRDTIHPAFTRFKALTEKIERITEHHLEPMDQVGYLWPRNYSATSSEAHAPNDFQLHNDLMISGRRSGQSAVTIYPSFFKYGNHAIEPMSKIKLIYATRHFGSEQSTINSPGAKDWVAAGGVLFVELDHQSSPPNWLNVGNAMTSHTTFNIASASPFGQPRSGLAKGLSKVALKLTNVDEVWGTWDGSTDCAIGLKRYGNGAVVLIGTDALTHSFDPVPGMNSYIFGYNGVNRKFEYLRIGHNVLTRPTSETGGDVTIPTKWLGATTEHWLMDLKTGDFSTEPHKWKWWTLQGGYVFNVPSGQLLLSITNPNP